MKNSPLHVALVDSDAGTHQWVRQALEVCGIGWTLDSHFSPDSLLESERPAPCSARRNGFWVLAAETNDSLPRILSGQTEFGL